MDKPVKYELENIAKERLKAQAIGAAGEHPDAGLLTAFTEQSLPAAEREQVLMHLAMCADCREVITLSLPQADEEALPAFVSRPATGGWFPLRWEKLGWAKLGTAVAGVAVISGALLVMRNESPRIGDNAAKSVAPVSSQPAKSANRDLDRASVAEMKPSEAQSAPYVSPKQEKQREAAGASGN